jgi:molybdate transport system substrate-binding protein
VPEIAAAFERSTGRKVKLAFGASGNLSRQIREGAPFELFLSADQTNVAMLAAAGRTEGEGVVYATGRLVLFVPSGSPVKADPQLAGLGDALRAGAVRRVAIANPDLAPYGAAARQALEKRKLWPLLEGKVALGESVSQTAQFALAGGVDAAFIPYSIVMSPNFRDRGAHAVLSPELHGPIVQRMALVKGAGETARRLYDFLQGAEARAILARYGFGVPASGGR